MRGFVLLCMVCLLTALAAPALAHCCAGGPSALGQQALQPLENSSQVLEVPVFYEISHPVAKAAAVAAVAPVKAAAAVLEAKPARRALAGLAHLKPARRAAKGVGLLLHPRRR